MLTDDREGSICYGNPSLLFVFRQVCPVRDWSVGLIVCLGCIVHVHFSGDSLGMIALIISSHMIMLLLISSEKLEKLHGGGVRDDKSRVVRGCKNPAASGRRMDGLNGQLHGFHRPHRVIRFRGVEFFQPRPHLHRLPVLTHAHQRGNYGGHCRGMVRWYLVLRIARRRSISALVLINGRQSEFLPCSRLRKLNLYFCVVHH
nr:MAG TPA: hypothetical protein [Bacteriophage sp.]